MSPTSLRHQSRRTTLLARAILDALEQRMLMHAGDVHDTFHPIILDVHDLPAIESTTSTGTGPDVGISTSGPIAISQLQKYHSRPGTAARLYLDFNGANAMTWGQYNVPAQTAWSSDADHSSFSDAEQQAIYEIWARVAEKYSPFNIDVTTEDPGNRTPHQTLAVVFASDDGSWLGSQAGGVAYINSFQGGTGGNTAFVFPKNLGPYHPKFAAEAAAHESGHAFGLNHQATWSGTTKTNEYNPGDSLVAPIMGNSYSAQRGLWSKGTSAASSTTIQDDLALLASSANRFGYAADDHANTVSSGTVLTLNGTSLSSYGVIEQITDADVFSFTTGTGTVNFTVDPAAYGAMLNLQLSLYTSAGGLITTVNNATFSETLNVTVNEGTYKLVVASNGAYGDIGQYRLRGTAVTPTTPPAPALNAPTNLTATASAGQVSLTWTDTNSSETGYVVQRSTDGATFANYATLSANSAAFTDAAISAGSTYTYRVLATDASSSSPASNTAAVTLAPATPVSLTATGVSSTQINLAWSDVAGETGYRIERSTDGTTFSTLATVGANVLTYASTGLTASTTYTYRIVAANAGGSSAASPFASATTQAAPVTPALNAPTNLTVRSQKNNRFLLTWTDTNSAETGYRIEYSTNGATFSLLANVAANTTGYNTGRLTGTLYFRIRAYNASSTSPYSTTAQATGAARGNSATLASLPTVAETTPTHSATRLLTFLIKLPARMK